MELQSRIFDLGCESLVCNLSECGSPVRPPSLLGGSHARKRHSSIFVIRSILNQKTEGGQCYDDMTIVKTASGSAYFCDLCETWNLSETASCFDVSPRVRLAVAH